MKDVYTHIILCTDCICIEYRGIRNKLSSS